MTRSFSAFVELLLQDRKGDRKDDEGMNVSTQKDSYEWLRLYRDEYWTLEEVGGFVGITREGIRQRLHDLRIKPRSGSETRALREAHTLSRKRDAMREFFLATRDLKAVAKEFDIPLNWAERGVADTVPDYRVLARLPRSTRKLYSREDLVGSLRAAAVGQDSNLTTAGYAAYVEVNSTLEDGRPRPGAQSMMLRFGSWSGALHAASLPANAPGGPSKQFSQADALAAVVTCWQEVGTPPSAAAYDAWQRGRDEPSAATVRKLAGGWNVLMVQAWQIVHGEVLAQDDLDTALPDEFVEVVSSEATTTYRTADDGVTFELPSDLNWTSYSALERAVRSHARIQNAVAAAARDIGAQAASPTAMGPQFDVLVSMRDGRNLLVEVKSATEANIDLQLRIAVGQVLWYRQELEVRDVDARPAIAIELSPNDDWRRLLASLRIELIVEDTLAQDLASAFAD